MDSDCGNRILKNEVMTFPFVIGASQQKRKSIFVYTKFAFSIRKIRNSYSGYCMRVRRSSDDATQDVGFIGENLDTASLLTFVGEGNGYVTIWYDQSGESNNAIQSNTTYQPKIVDSGNLLTLGGKPTIYFNTAYLEFTAVSTPDYVMLFTVLQVLTHSANYDGYFTMGNVNIYGFVINSGKSTWVPYFTRTYNGGGTLDGGYKTYLKNLPTLQYLEEWLYSGSGLPDYYNNGYKPEVSSSFGGINSALRSGRIGSLSQAGNVVSTITLNIQELDLYNTDKYSVRTVIEDNINEFYQLFPSSLPDIILSDLTYFNDFEDSKCYPGSGNNVYSLIYRTDSSLIGSPTFNSNSPKSLILDGTNDYINANYSVTYFIKNNDGTVSVWFKPTGTSPTKTAWYQGQIIFGDSNMYVGITRCVISGNDRIWVANYPAAPIGVEYSVNEWINITWVHTGGVLYAYKNGYEVSHVTSGNSGGNILRFGYGDASSSYFAGEIAIALAYNKGLSASQVLDNYNALKDRFI